MMKILKSIKESAKELKKLTSLTVAAMLIALNTVLGLYTIMIGQFIKIGFSYLALGLGAYLYGPVVAGIIGGAGDIINYVIKPTGPFFPGFTINSILTGVLYGLFLYKKPVSFPRIFLAKLTVKVFIDLLLSTTWLSILYGQAFIVLLPMRALKAVITLPIESGILYLVINRFAAVSNKIVRKRDIIKNVEK
ncbi:MAG: Folate family ECF transporter S component [Lachnoclostridium sp.]|jgi:riboflavin transporter